MRFYVKQVETGDAGASYPTKSIGKGMRRIEGSISAESAEIAT
jgi:hypothetical protein